MVKYILKIERKELSYNGLFASIAAEGSSEYTEPQHIAPGVIVVGDDGSIIGTSDHDGAITEKYTFTLSFESDSDPSVIRDSEAVPAKGEQLLIRSLKPRAPYWNIDHNINIVVAHKSVVGMRDEPILWRDFRPESGRMDIREYYVLDTIDIPLRSPQSISHIPKALRGKCYVPRAIFTNKVELSALHSIYYSAVSEMPRTGILDICRYTDLDSKARQAMMAMRERRDFYATYTLQQWLEDVEDGARYPTERLSWPVDFKEKKPWLDIYGRERQAIP